MRYQWTESFARDFRGMAPEHQELFLRLIPEFSDACDRWIGENTGFPGKFRVSPLQGAPGIFEMTWSFAGLDGRATWMWSSIVRDGVHVPVVVWRRIGTHRIYREP